MRASHPGAPAPMLPHHSAPWFRSGAAFRRGKGKIFYFSPGDQEYPVYHQAEIQRVLANAVQWARPEDRPAQPVRIANAQRDWFRGEESVRAI